MQINKLPYFFQIYFDIPTEKSNDFKNSFHSILHINDLNRETNQDISFVVYESEIEEGTVYSTYTAWGLIDSDRLCVDLSNQIMEAAYNKLNIIIENFQMKYNHVFLDCCAVIKSDITINDNLPVIKLYKYTGSKGYDVTSPCQVGRYSYFIE